MMVKQNSTLLKQFDILTVAAFLLFAYLGQAQTQTLEFLEDELLKIQEKESRIIDKMDVIRLSNDMDVLKSLGLPSQTYFEHSAFAFEYSEEHEQSRWVAHVISPEIAYGTQTRTNDFRIDPLVSTGTAEQEDYFLTSLDPKGETVYDGFGYDRGHLAPSADFRWSELATSESYFYSNMSPMLPDFNRKIWAELESLMRSYVYNNEVELYVVSGPILETSLPKIERSTNGVSIPRKFFKVAYDKVNNKAIAFVIPQNYRDTRLENYAVTVDELEALISFDIFPNIDNETEASYQLEDWMETFAGGSVEAIPFVELPYHTFNTISGSKQMGSNKEVKVCGTVVSSRYSNSGNAWLNLDRKYPNDYFNVMIKKDQLINFSYDPVTALANEKYCFTGEVIKIGSNPTMIIDREEKINTFVAK